MDSGVSYFLGLFVAAGGVIGFLKANSTVSLISGITFGSLFGYTGYYISGHRNDINGFKMASGLSAMLLFLMGWRYLNSKKFMPSGMVASLSFLSFVFYASRLI